MSIETSFPLIEVQKLAKIESGRRQFYRPLYSLHKWWARRPGVTFRAIGLSNFINSENLFKGDFFRGIPYYLNYNLNDKVILDPFMGGGTTIVEMNRLGLNTIGIDLNPVAWWTVKKELDPFNEEKFKNIYKTMKNDIGEHIKSFYKTKCTKCNNKADIMYSFWVKKINCPVCSKEVELYKYYILGKKQRGDKHTKVLCPACKDLFFTNKPVSVKTQCLECKLEFIPSKGNTRNKIVHCGNCDQNFKLNEALQRQSNPLDANLIALEFYCTKCNIRDYKKPSIDDIREYKNAEKIFNEMKEDLLFPKDKIPTNGKTTNQLINYNYTKFSDLFNKRQLLCLSLLLKKIKEIDDQDLMEYFLAAFSSSLEFHTVLCPYNYTQKQIVNVFNYQSFLIPTMHVENNVWGISKGNGTFITYINRVLKAKKYCTKPFEVFIEGREKKKQLIPNDRILGTYAENFDDLMNNENKNTLLLCSSSEDLSILPLDIPSKSIDAVITDPPYFSTIQYSELSDFYYVWLKLLLECNYKEFSKKLTSKFNEIVVNETRNKDEQSFLQGLTCVFSECNRVLKDKSPLIFTFHHKESEAWASVLGAILNSGFYITAVFPIVSEFQLKTVRSINYDAIIVCRKRKSNTSIIWEVLEDLLYDQLDEKARQIRTQYHTLSKGDQMIILFGKCLETVSKYQKIVENEKEMSINELIVRVLKIVDEKTVDEFIPNLDNFTRIFLTVVIDQEIWSLDELNKRIRHQQIDIEELQDELFLEKKDNYYYILNPENRYELLKRRFGKSPNVLNLIDRIHLLYYHFKNTDEFNEFSKKWGGDETLIQICDFLAKKTGNNSYTKIRNSLIKSRRIQTQL